MSPTVLLVVTALGAAMVTARGHASPCAPLAASARRRRPAARRSLAPPAGAPARRPGRRRRRRGRPALGRTPGAARSSASSSAAPAASCSACSTTCGRSSPQTKLTAQLVIATAAVSVGLRLPGHRRRLGRHADRHRLAGRAVDGLQPARQHGRPRRRRRGRSRRWRMALLFAGAGRLDAALLAAAVGGACAGFLLHNFSPASIFMGDAGSLFLGFMVGGLAWPPAPRSGPARSAALLLPAADRAGADLRHRLRHRAPLRRRAADRARRPRSHVASPRRRRLQRAAGRRRALWRVGARRASPRVATARIGARRHRRRDRAAGDRRW